MKPTGMQRIFDDKQKFFESRIEERLSSKSGGKLIVKHGETSCQGKIDDLHWETQTRRLKEFPTAANRCPPNLMCVGTCKTCTENNYFSSRTNAKFVTETVASFDPEVDYPGRRSCDSHDAGFVVSFSVLRLYSAQH